MHWSVLSAEWIGIVPRIVPRIVPGKTVSLAASAVLLAAACSSAAEQSKTQSPTDVVATVGGTSITLAQVDEVALQQPAGNFGSARLVVALY